MDVRKLSHHGIAHYPATNIWQNVDDSKEEKEQKRKVKIHCRKQNKEPYLRANIRSYLLTKKTKKTGK